MTQIVNLGGAILTLCLCEDSSVKFVYFDPPFYTQEEFADFSDTWVSMTEYLMFLRRILMIIREKLSDDGVLALHCDWHAEYEIESLLRQLFDSENIANKIYTRRAPKSTKNIVKKLRHNTDTIFYVYKDIEEGHIITPPTRPVEGKDRWASMTGGGPGGPKRFGERWVSPPDNRHFMWSQEHIDREWNLGNIRFTTTGNPLYRVTSDYIICGNLWDDIPAYAHTWKYSTQKHLSLLERLVLMSSREDDIICDPMCGSGTTAVAAKKLGRQYVVGDKNPRAIKITNERLAKLESEEYDIDFEE